MRADRKDLQKDEVLSQALRALPACIPPPGLTTSLRVIASRHRQQRQSSRSGVTWRDRARLFATNLMRPLALPFAGGVFSTVVLFSTYLMATYPVRGSSTFDVPTGLFTEATVKGTGPIGAAGEDVIVDVTVNDQGRMVDYTIVSAGADESLKRSIETMLLFTEFTPATAFGQPVSARMRISLRKSFVDVKG